MEDWVTIKNHKAKNPSISLRQIAKFLHVSHHTVKKALSEESPPEYKRPEKINAMVNVMILKQKIRVENFSGLNIFFMNFIAELVL